MEWDLDQLLPDPIELTRGGQPYATLPGELPATEMLKLERLREAGSAHEELLKDTPDTPENAAIIEEARAGIAHFYEQAAAFLQQHAEMANEGDLLELTATQIIAVCSALAAPQQRLILLATAFAMACGMELSDDGQVVDEGGAPLDEGSPGTSSGSDEPEDGKAPTGAPSRGASSSPSGRKRKTTAK